MKQFTLVGKHNILGNCVLHALEKELEVQSTCFWHTNLAELQSSCVTEESVKNLGYKQ